MKLALLALLAIVLIPRPALATGWAVVAVTDSDDRVVDGQFLAKRIEASLLASGVELVPPEQARTRFESSHSTAPVVLAPDALASLRKQAQDATRYLAMRRLKEALAATEKLRHLDGRAQDYLRRELAQAQELFDVCIVTASQIADGGDQVGAYRHMLDCAERFPALTPDQETYTQEIRKLYDSVIARLEDKAELVVRSADGSACTTRVNGIDWGKAPARISATPTEVRVQVECSKDPGRVHTIKLVPGQNQVTIDPVFDAAVRSTEPRITLVYGSGSVLAARRERDMGAVAAAVGADHVVAIELSVSPTVRLFDATGAVMREVEWRGPLDNPAELQRVTGALLQPGQAAPAATAAAPVPPDATQATEPARKRVHWLVPTAIAVGYGVSIAGTAYALANRSGRREDALNGVAAEGYDGVGVAGIVLTTTGSALATTMEAIGLPARETVPWWAWVSGAAGIGVAGTGIYLLAGVDSCDVGNRDTDCVTWIRDSLAGPLFLVGSVPLLALPLTYAFSAGRADTTAALAVGSDRVTLTVRGDL